jgi:hypothetical protein
MTVADKEELISSFVKTYTNRDVSCCVKDGVLRIEYSSGPKVIGCALYEENDFKVYSVIGLDITNWVMNGVLDKRIVRV